MGLSTASLNQGEPLNIRQRLSGWVTRLYRWLTEAKLAIMCLLLITAALMLGFATWQSERSIRLSGYALQLIGMLFTISGLLGIRNYFKQPSLKSLINSWFRRFPKWKIAEITGEADITLRGFEADGNAEFWINNDPSKPIEEQISDLIKNLETIRYGQRNHTHSIGQLERHQGELEKKITEAIKNTGDEIRAEMELSHTSDIIPSLAGLVLLLVGISMSTLAPELHACFY